MKGVSRGPRGVRRASAAHSRTHSVWPSAGARFAARPCAVPIDALGGGGCFPGLSSVRVRFILLTYLRLGIVTCTSPPLHVSHTVGTHVTIEIRLPLSTALYGLYKYGVEICSVS